ncbi:MAG: M6 family metalloprotease domain-containing protein [Candidatus Marinimicrobia bacterium]|nr:M6 family metalloprotease domain-containing protein [Candidatus Neomarinimicrobiota bacterium]
MNMYEKIYILLIGTISLGFGAYLENIPVTLHQPDGTSLDGLSSGDEFYVRLHDENNYTVIQSPDDGYYYYAQFVSGEVIASQFRADLPLPENSGILREVRISREEYLRKRSRFDSRDGERDAPTFGTVNNINIFIRFADENEFATPRSIMDEPFNKPDGPSLKHYYDEVSYSQVEVNTHHFPICDMSTNLSYQDQYPRSYYQPYNAQTNPNGYNESNQTNREHTMLKNAIEFIYTEVPLELDVDGDGDGYVDNVNFQISGSPDGWSDLLWPHRWSLFSYTVYINGSVVESYNLNLSSGGYFNVGTLCHEFFHSMGAPDLYHYTATGAPTAAGGWDVMDGGGGGDYPVYMSAWMKHKYGGWIDCPEINQMGIYPLLPLQYQESSCYRIESPNSYNEFFILEYRKKEGIYETSTPNSYSGMLIYRINDNLNGNGGGPPDELYLYRPNGTTTANGNLNNAIFSAETGRSEFNDATNPSCFLSNDQPGGLNIQNIGEPGDIIEFEYWNIYIQTIVSGISNDNDNDAVLNPGESATIHLSINVESGSSDAENVVAEISSELDWVHFSPSTIDIGSLPENGNTVEIETTISLDDIGELLPATFILDLYAEFDDEGTSVGYYDEYYFELEVSLNQAGFPIESNEIRSSPLVIDLDNDGLNEIIFGDYDGVIHIYNADGSEQINSDFPFDTGSQIWGSPAGADLDGDSMVDVVVVSKNKHLYIFDTNGFKLDYETEVYLIGTPAIGNLDEDDDLEIVFSGYSSNNKLFAINIDGSDVLGFPIEINEKAKAGPALADFNDNGRDDIVLGTDNDNLYLILDDGTTATGFPFLTGDKIQTAPSIIEINGEKTIFAGSNDNYLYAVNSDGSLQFSFMSEDKIQSSPSFLEINGEAAVFFGNNFGYIHGLDMNGIPLTGWPVIMNGDIEGSVVFSDLDGDGVAEVVATTNTGELGAFYLDGNPYPYFPILNGSPFKGSPSIINIDNDEDLEIMGGSANSLTVIDIKEFGSNDNYWHVFRGNNMRNGFSVLGENECDADLGDVTGDGNINILDLVQVANLILEVATSDFECAADYTQDGEVNILDLVQIANYILES